MRLQLIELALLATGSKLPADFLALNANQLAAWAIERMAQEALA